MRRPPILLSTARVHTTRVYIYICRHGVLSAPSVPPAGPSVEPPSPPPITRRWLASREGSKYTSTRKLVLAAPQSAIIRRAPRL